MRSTETKARRPWPIYAACAFFLIIGLLPVTQILIETSDLRGALLVGLLGPLLVAGFAAFAFAGSDFGRHALLAFFGISALASIFGWIAGIPYGGLFRSSLADVAVSLALLGVVTLLYLPTSNDWYNSER